MKHLPHILKTFVDTNVTACLMADILQCMADGIASAACSNVNSSVDGVRSRDI